MFRDLRYTLRSLLKRPGFTVVVVATLALGIGVNAAIFSVFNILLRPLPVKEPESIARLFLEEGSKRSDVHASRGDSCTGWKMIDNNPATISIVSGGKKLYQLHASADLDVHWR
jgi:hypothetical protein